MGKCTERLYNGIVKENPTFVLMLGMCPTLAVTTSAINGAGMGLATTCILVMSNMVISMLRKVIPDKVRIPAYIVIIASFVTIIQFLMEAYFPSLNSSLGLYIPLIVVNCIILGRAESYASKNKVFPSIFDGLGMGLGFTIGLTVIGIFRELIGNGSVFNFQILGEGNIWQDMPGIGKTVGDALEHYTPIAIFVRAPGAFLVLAFLVAFINKRNAVKSAKAGDGIATCRPESCATCTNTMCGGKFFTAPVVAEPEVQAEPEEEKPKVVIPEKIERKPVEEEAKPQEEEKKETAETESVSGEQAASEHQADSEVKSESVEEQQEENTEPDGEKKGDAGAEPDGEQSAEKEESDGEQPEGEQPDEKESVAEEQSDAEQQSETEELPKEQQSEENQSEETASTEESLKEDIKESEGEEHVEEIPRAKIQEVVENVEEVQESMHESDVVSTSKLTRPEVEDASMIDKYEEFIDADVNQKKRKRKNKRGKGGKR